MTRLVVTAGRARAASAGRGLTHLLASTLVLLAVLLGFIAESEGWLENFQVFLLLTVTLLSYSLVQSWLVYSKQKQFFLFESYDSRSSDQ